VISSAQYGERVRAAAVSLNVQLDAGRAQTLRAEQVVHRLGDPVLGNERARNVSMDAAKSQRTRARIGISTCHTARASLRETEGAMAEQSLEERVQFLSAKIAVLMSLLQNSPIA